MTDRRREMKSLGEALDWLTGQLGLDERRPGVAVQEHWAEAVGEDVAAHARPRGLDDGVLTVEVDDPAWATHLRYLGPSLAASLNTAIGASVVREVRVVVVRPGRP